MERAQFYFFFSTVAKSRPQSLHIYDQLYNSMRENTLFFFLLKKKSQITILKNINIVIIVLD